MGKRSDFPRRAQDAYDTPPEAVAPLLGHLPNSFTFWEPCAGDGSLIKAFLTAPGKKSLCIAPSDIAPRHKAISQEDALQPDRWAPHGADYIITNPPWTRQILHPMIEHFAAMCPTWLLFDADWMHTRQAVPYLKLCKKIVSVGRVKWIPDSPHTGKDNCQWSLFDANHNGSPPLFFGRKS